MFKIRGINCYNLDGYNNSLQDSILSVTLFDMFSEVLDNIDKKEENE